MPCWIYRDPFFVFFLDKPIVFHYKPSGGCGLSTTVFWILLVTNSLVGLLVGYFDYYVISKLCNLFSSLMHDPYYSDWEFKIPVAIVTCFISSFVTLAKNPGGADFRILLATMVFLLIGVIATAYYRRDSW